MVDRVSAIICSVQFTPVGDVCDLEFNSYKDVLLGEI